MALNFDKINIENENVSLEDLSIESLVQGDLDPSSITFNDLFEDHLSVLSKDNINIENDNIVDLDIDLDIDCIDLDKVWISECDATDCFEFENINITDFNNEHSNKSIDDDIVYVNDETNTDDNNFANEKESIDTPKKNSTIIRRQSTRIENQTRKKIAEQIQRENVRLAMEAQLLNNKSYEEEKKISVHIINGRPASPETERYLSMPTDLDAEEEDEIINKVDIASDEDPNKVWCLCRKPHGNRFMICCDNCLEWYHGDCVDITQKEGDDMEEFICPSCKTNMSTIVTVSECEEVVVIDDEDEGKDLIGNDDEDCLITKAVEPMKFNENIFQLINKSQIEINLTRLEMPTVTLPALSKRTSVCLTKNCKSLVNPKKSLYCSRNCIDKYTKMVIKNNLREKAKQYGLPKGPKLAKMTRFVLAQPATDTIQDEFAAPTQDTLKDFLIKNPTYKVYQSSKPIKTKESQEKSKKFLELVNSDPSKHIKIVKLFATLFKKFMLPKSFNLEFRNIWERCVNIETALFESCDKEINDNYMSKVKELSEYLKIEGNDRVLLDILHNKLNTTDFVSMTKDQLDSRSKVIIIDDTPVLIQDKVESTKKNVIISKRGISLLSDTTHLHGRHLYDINCKVCNGAKKSVADIKQKLPSLQDKDALPVFDNAVSSCTELSAEGKITYSSNNDEFAVTSSVATPDMVLDMEMCSSSSEKDDLDLKLNTNVLVDSSIIEKTNQVEIKNVLKPQKRKLTSLWQGNVTYKEVGTVMCKSYLVTRFFLNMDYEKMQEALPEDDEELQQLLDVTSSINSEIIISGRSQISETHNYLRRLRKHSNKEFLVLRLHPSNLDEGGNVYRSMFEFLHSRERCGVISDKKTGVKDCFLYPLNAHMKIPSIFMPFIGPGLEKRRPHLLLLIIIRTSSPHLHYQPFSPKYDYDDDFIKKHGINLDKYSNPNSNFPFYPSPIVNSNEVMKWILNSKSLEDEKEVSFIEFDVEDNVEKESDKSNIDNSKEKNEIKHSKRIRKSQKIGEKSENGWDDMAMIKLSDIPLPDSLPSESLKKDKNFPAQKDNVKRDTFTVLSDVLKKDLISEKCDIIKEAALTESVEDLSKISASSEPCHTETSEPDLSLRPTAFTYRFLTHNSSNIDLHEQAMKPDYEAKHMDEVEDLKSNRISPPKVDEYNEVGNSPKNLDFGGDIDLRKNVQDCPKSEIEDEDAMMVSSQSLFLKRRLSSRLYTLYDCFPSDVNSEKKRMKYFFNPFYQKADFINVDSEIMSPLIIDDYEDDTHGSVAEKTNVSVYSSSEAPHKPQM